MHKYRKGKYIMFAEMCMFANVRHNVHIRECSPKCANKEGSSKTNHCGGGFQPFFDLKKDSDPEPGQMNVR